MSHARIKPVKVTARKSFAIAIEDRKEGGRIISIAPRGPITPGDMLDGLLGGLASVYINLYGGENPATPVEDRPTQEEFCEMIAQKTLARLSSYKVESGTVQ